MKIFPKLPSISRDFNNKAIISPEPIEFTYLSSRQSNDPDNSGLKSMRKTLKMNMAKTKMSSKQNLEIKNE
jgi:hypothetical protein